MFYVLHLIRGVWVFRTPPIAMQSSIGSAMSAAEKKKLRRKKAKQSKKELKSSHVELHAALHKAQEAASSTQRDRVGKAQREGDGLLIGTSGDIRKHIIEYVPEPFTALEALSKAVEDAAIDDNPYDGVSGLQISDTGGGKSDLDELQRIAQHFASLDDTTGPDDAAPVVDQPLIETAVVKEKEQEKPDPEEGATACYGWNVASRTC